MVKKLGSLFLSALFMNSFVLASGVPENAKKALQKVVAARSMDSLTSLNPGPMSPQIYRRLQGNAQEAAMCKHLGDECDCWVVSEFKKSMQGNGSQATTVIQTLSPKLLLLKKANDLK